MSCHAGYTHRTHERDNATADRSAKQRVPDHSVKPGTVASGTHTGICVCLGVLEQQLFSSTLQRATVPTAVGTREERLVQKEAQGLQNKNKQGLLPFLPIALMHFPISLCLLGLEEEVVFFDPSVLLTRYMAKMYIASLSPCSLASHFACFFGVKLRFGPLFSGPS